jgi:hypothetical protein
MISHLKIQTLTPQLPQVVERLADIELIDGKMVFRRVVAEGIIEGIEFVRRGRSDTELYFALPLIFQGQCWAGYVPFEEQPGPDDIIEEPPSQSDLSEDELEAIQQRVEQDKPLVACPAPPL